MPRTRTPTLSVLLPFKDAAATLGEAATSVLGEREVPLELILIDDGSTDEGGVLARQLADRDPRVVVVRGAGEGIAGALARGLAVARGPLVGRMDADDVSLPGRFPAELDLLDRSPSVSVVGTQVEAFPSDAVGEGLRRYVAWQNALVSAEDHRRELFVESPLCHPSVVIRRDALDAVGPWRAGAGPEDYDLWLRMDAAGYGMAKVPEVLLRWRHQAGRATFADPRYRLERFIDAKAPHLARTLRTTEAGVTRPLVVWGAGQTGKRVARALEPHGVRPAFFVDIDPRKIGRTARGVPIRTIDALDGGQLVLVVVAARGAREEVREWLTARGHVETRDFWCAS
jgi:hypothetical protein